MNLIGNRECFAIESRISIAYAIHDYNASGSFVIHIGGKTYGIDAHDATDLGCSLLRVEERLATRGGHASHIADYINAGEIADAAYGSLFGRGDIEYSSLGLPKEYLENELREKKLFWVPNGDAAFDDGSFILQIDIGEQVRLIGFRLGELPRHDPATLADVRISSDEFYGILESWRCIYKAQWYNLPKHPGYSRDPFLDLNNMV